MSAPTDESVKRLDGTSAALEHLNAVLSLEEPLDEVLDRLARQVAHVVHDADEVSVTVIEDGAARTAAATAPMVVEIDKVQYSAGDGPCLDAATQRRPVRVSVEVARGRWPAFAEAADQAGVRSYLSSPLVLDPDGTHVGSLNLYGRHDNAFDPFDEALLKLFGSAASAAIGNAGRYLEARRHAEQLALALTSRAEIDQAKGVLMALRGIDADAAFDALRAQSQHTQVKLRDVARQLLAGLRTDSPAGAGPAAESERRADG